MSSSAFIAAAVLTLLASSPANAQTQDAFTTVQCQDSYKWAENSLGQSPCLVAAYLQSACIGYGAVYPLEFNHFYGPSIPPKDCQCSTAMYSVYAACGDCQGGLYPSWTHWKGNCTTTYLSSFPKAIPGGTAVPGWAYLDVTTKDTYDPIAAKAGTKLAEVTGTGKPSVTALKTTGSASRATGTAKSSSNSTTGSSSHSNKSNVGAIVGGVIGGLVILGLLGLGIAWFLMRKRRNRTAPSVEYMAANLGGPLSPPLMTANYNSSGMYGTGSMPGTPKLYDPSNPATFPGSPLTTSDMTTAHTLDYSRHSAYTNYGAPAQIPQPQPQPGGYSGAPEL